MTRNDGKAKAWSKRDETDDNLDSVPVTSLVCYPLPSVLTTRSTPRSLGLSLATLPPFPSVTSETSGDRGSLDRWLES